MVLIHYKKTEHNQFLYETVGTTPIEDLIMQLVTINNLRVVIDRLAVAIEDLATHGVLKPEELRGLSSEDTIKYALETLPENKKKWAEKIVLQPGQRYNEDKSHYRLGVILNEETTKMMIDTANQAKQAINKNLVQLNQKLTVEALKLELDKLRGAVMIAYPGYHGLPEWEPCKLILENQHQLEGQETDVAEYLIEKDTSLWWAGKELLRGKQLRDYVGKNEKTKIIVRLQKNGTGAPVREPAIDEETYKKMISYYHKKQEESKQLEEDSDDHYLNAAWANPNQLKGQLHGTDNINWKPGKK